MRTPIGVRQALGRFETLWSPRIVTRVNDYDVRIAKVQGDHVWHDHRDTDEFFLVLDGELRIDLRDRPDGAAILMFEPAGTSTVGDVQDVPEHVDATTGHPLT